MTSTQRLQTSIATKTPLSFLRDENALPPVIILGGTANALSVARAIGRLGASVYLLNDAASVVRYSRYCKLLPVTCGKDAWAEFLLGPSGEPFQGAVLLTCSDDGIQLIAEHRAALSERFVIDIMNVDAQLMMLNKLSTYDAATAAGVPTPKYWVAGGNQGDELDKIASEAVFPLIVKPRLSHVCESVTGVKLIVAKNRDELVKGVDEILATGTETLIVELIPGLDDQLCSYFTYLDEECKPLFHFTKRIIRRYPLLRGTACYHITDDIPKVAELGLRLFQHVGLQGLANVEFKYDARDGQYKLIECNARFTASNCLVAASGIDLSVFVYNTLTGRPLPPTDRFIVGKRLWDPIRDYQAARELRRSGQLTLGQWIKSVCHPQCFPYFEWTDPLPALRRMSKGIANTI